WRSGVFPPAETPDALAGRLNNAQIRWSLKRPLNWHPPEWPAGQTTGPADFSPFPVSNTPAHIVLARYEQSNAQSYWYTRGQLAGPLLIALEDPNRFIAAHVLLTTNTLPPSSDGWESRADGTFVHTFNGLRTELTPKPNK